MVKVKRALETQNTPLIQVPTALLSEWNLSKYKKFVQGSYINVAGLINNSTKLLNAEVVKMV